MQDSNRWIRGGLAAATAALLGASGGAQAGTLQKTLQITAHVTGACSNLDTSPMNFDFAAGADAPAASSTLSVTCSTGTQWTITASADAAYACTPAGPAGTLADGNGDTLSFKLSGDTNVNTGTPLQTTPACGTGAAIAGSGTGAAQSVPIYGVIASAANAQIAGDYSSAVTLLLTF